MKPCSSCEVAALCMIGRVRMVRNVNDLTGVACCAAFLRIPVGPKLLGTRHEVSDKCPRAEKDAWEETWTSA
jgi:hypothetical protein